MGALHDHRRHVSAHDFHQTGQSPGGTKLIPVDNLYIPAIPPGREKRFLDAVHQLAQERWA